MLFTAAALVAAGISGGIILNARAEAADRRLALFGTERQLAAGEIVQLRKRGGDEGNRITAHFRYSARGQERTGATRLRRDDHDAFAVGTPVGVWFLPSDPGESWLDGYSPRPHPHWPAAAVPFVCTISAMGLILVVRRQMNLLAHGRPAAATVTKIEKKKGEYGTSWVVHYQFTTLSGATRTGKYEYSKKDVPAAGASIPIVYDRDNTSRHGRYPMSFVRIHDH